jgi:tetratricopeptide (TPR) repeat protein
MTLAGRLRTMALPDVLQWLAMGRKTGTLVLERRSVQKKIVFRDGSIYSSWSNDPRESLGQFLLRERLATEEQIFTALLRQEERKGLLGSILVADGIVTEDALRRSLQLKAEEMVYELFLWPDGQFEFKEGELPPDVQIAIEMDVNSVLMEGIRRIDEWARIRQVFPSTRTTFRLAGQPLVKDPTERQILHLAALGKTLAEIALEMRRSEFDAAVLLFELYGRGYLVVQDPGEDTKALDTVEAIRDRLAFGDSQLNTGRYEVAMKAYEEVLALDRLNQQAKKGLVAAVEARDRERALKRVPLTKVPVMLMDLATLTKQKFDPEEGFVLSRVTGEWDVQSILKVCPMREETALLIFARLIDRGVIGFR